MRQRGPIRRVFLSSPLRDLEAHRDAAKRTIAKFQKVYDDFTEWTPQSGSPLQASLRRVETCDLLVLLVAHRYGEPLAELGGKSITHAEVEAALAREIPVRAFFVKEDFAWQVRDVDSDQSQLDAFRAYVKKFCTPSYFGSPESLEIELSRCLLELLIEEGLKPEAAIASLVRPRPMEELSPFNEGAYLLGKAPDGVQLALQISLSERELRSFGAKIETLIGHCQMKNGAETVAAIVDSAREVARGRAKRRWLAIPPPVDGEGIGQTFLIRNDRSLTYMLRSILDSCLGSNDQAGQTGVDRPVMAGQSSRTPTGAASAPELEDDDDELRLAVGIDRLGNRHVLVSNRTLWHHRREYIEETLTSLSGAVFAARFEPRQFGDKKVLAQACEELARHGARLEVASIEHTAEQLKKEYLAENPAKRYTSRGVHATFNNIEAYHRVLSDTETRVLTGSCDYYVKIPVAALVSLVTAAAEEVASTPGVIHGNIKPSNIFTTDAGVVVVDGYNVPFGEPTPFFSNEWASPEQAMGEGLDEGTDVYSLCRILCVLLRLHISGELVTFRVSGGSAAIEREFQFVRRPYIHYKPNPEVAQFPDRHKLNDLLEGGLAGDRRERISSLADLIGRLRSIDFSKLVGVRSLSLRTPPLGSRLMRLENGSYVPYRAVEEDVKLDPEIEDEERAHAYSSTLPVTFEDRRRRTRH